MMDGKGRGARLNPTRIRERAQILVWDLFAAPLPFITLSNPRPLLAPSSIRSLGILARTLSSRTVRYMYNNLNCIMLQCRPKECVVLHGCSVILMQS